LVGRLSETGRVPAVVVSYRGFRVAALFGPSACLSPDDCVMHLRQGESRATRVPAIFGAARLDTIVGTNSISRSRFAQPQP
jgi:hypothetical protein